MKSSATSRSAHVRDFLTIIPRARMGSESIAHGGERNWLIKYRDKTSFAS